MCLDKASLPDSYWPEAAAYTVHLCNHSLSWTKDSIVPYTLWMGKTADVAHLCAFGCMAYLPIEPKSTRTAFGLRATKCILLGNYTGSKSYKLLDKETGKVHKSHHVCFVEDEPPYCDNLLLDVTNVTCEGLETGEETLDDDNNGKEPGVGAVGGDGTDTAPALAPAPGATCNDNTNTNLKDYYYDSNHNLRFIHPS